MKTHSTIQRCQVYLVTIRWCFPLSCPFSTFLFPACFSFYSIFFFLLPLLPFLPYPFLSLFLPSSSLYKVLKPVLTLCLILDFNLYLIFSGTTKFRRILFCCTFLLYFADLTFFFFLKNLVVHGNSVPSKSIGTIFPKTFAHFVPLCRALVILAIFQTLLLFYLSY